MINLTVNGAKVSVAAPDDMPLLWGEDELVGWAWNPGRGRQPAPGTQKAFGELIKAWADSGGACPGS